MGNTQTKPSTKLSNIDREVKNLRSSVRSSTRKFTAENKEQLVQTLVQYSNEVSSLRGKVSSHKLEQVQTSISDTMQDILSMNPQEPDLDLGTVETSSIIQVSLSKRQVSNQDLSEVPSKKQKSNQISTFKMSTSTLEDIEEKFRTLRPQIKNSIESGDLNQLRLHQQTLHVMVTDLEMLNVKEHTTLSDRKQKLEKSIVSQFNKIKKVMADIRRNKDMNYLMQQNKRSIHELEDIQKEISDIESVISTLLQNKDQFGLNGLRENILIVRQRLTSIEIEDETRKQLQKQLLNKLADILKCVDDSTKGSSQSDLTKAQVHYEELVRNIASGHSVDKDEIKMKLESLQQFINSIKDDNESVLRGKQQLLNNVRQSFSFILDNHQKIQNVDVEVGGKQDTTIVLDTFCNSWKSLQENLNTSALDDLSQIDEVLRNIQQSIEEKRQELAEHRSLPTSFNRALNRSTPNLVSPRVVHSKFGSSVSVDQTDKSLIKAKVKVYDMPTPQVQSINDQPVVLRNKQFYQNSSSTPENRPFSQIEEIKTQVNYIKEKYQESPQKQHLKNKLESYTEIINGFVHHQNQRIANGARSVLTDIQEMLTHMSDIPGTMNQRRNSIELSLENVVSIQGSVEQIEKAVAAFQGQKDDAEYNKIFKDLSECAKYLQRIEIPAKYDMVQQQREEILKKIEAIYNVLQNKCLHHYEDVEIVNTKKKLDSLKKKVTRFSGAYRGVLYNQIEKDLNRLLVDVTPTLNDKVIADDITRDVEKHLKILEHRATKDQSFRRPLTDSKSKSEEEEKLIKLKNDLLSIKAGIDTTPANSVNIFLGLKSRLDLVKLGLDQLKFTLEDEEKQKDILYNEVESLKNVVEAKISLAKQALKQWPLEQDQEKVNLEELKNIELKFKKLKPEIESFIGTTSDNKFYELDENSIRLILKMDKLQFDRGSEAHNKKIELLKEIYNYGDLLDQRAKESEDLLDIERSLQDIQKNFARNLKLNDLESLQDKVVALKTKIDNGEYNSNLTQRKQACIKAIEDLFGRIADNKKQSASQNAQKENTENDPAHMISNIELEFGNIKKGIDVFSGTLSDSKYYELNSSVTALFLKLDNLKLPESSDLRPRKITLLKKMRKYTEILHNKAKEFEAVLEIDRQLNYINKKVDNYKGQEQDLTELENELKSVQMKMENLKIQGQEQGVIHQKLDILINEYNRLKQTKPAPDNYIGSTSFHSDVENNLNRNKVPQNLQRTTGIRLAELEKEISIVRQKCATFIHCDTSQEYKTIEDTLLRLKMRLNKLDTERNTEFIRKQHELEKGIDECFTNLDERSSEAASITEIETLLEKVSKKLEADISEQAKGAIDEALISIQVKLGKLRVNKDLDQRRNRCAETINNLLKQLKDKDVYHDSSDYV